MTTVLLDTHVLYWWSSEPRRLSSAATRAIERANELDVASITWYELAWLARNERINAPMPVQSWLEQLSSRVYTVGVTPAIAVAAASLGGAFSRDPADRLIYATAIEHGLMLVTKDERMASYKHSRRVVVW